MSLMDELRQELSLSSSQLRRFIARSPHSYKNYYIPKKNGGVRLVSQPARETKRIQYWLIEKLFSRLRVSEFAMAYRPGIGIKDNAVMHLMNPYISKFDFDQFFNSIDFNSLVGMFVAELQLEQSDAEQIARVSCIAHPVKGLCLSIGAPSSPILSNAFLYDFDRLVGDRCSSREVIYTRYADDITFSYSEKGLHDELRSLILEVLCQLGLEGIKINEKKSVKASKKNLRAVTGVVLTNNHNPKLSIGRAKKREIKSLINSYVYGELAADKISYLQGLLGYVKHMEPGFLSALSSKYGARVISEILSRFNN